MSKITPWLSTVMLSSVALLSACGGGSSGMSSVQNQPTSSANGATAQSCGMGGCGTAMVSLTDAPGDFLSYLVNVVSLRLTRKDGTVVETVPATTQVDFAQLVDLSEIISAGLIPPGEYVSVSMTLDYSKATIVVDNGSGGVTISNIINKATSMPFAAPVTMTLMLDSNHHLFITANTVADLALDFNLAASNTITPSDTSPTTVTVAPMLTASLVPDVTKQLRVRGAFVSADTSASTFLINVRPFYDADGTFGQFTGTTTATTTYSINGTSYTGSAGLTALAASTAGTMIAAYGTWDTAARTFTASSVLAGSSVPGEMHDALWGTVIARSGNTLTLAHALMQHMHGDAQYNGQTTVLVSTATQVTELGQSGAFTIADISVGQRVEVSGAFSDDDSNGDGNSNGDGDSSDMPSSGMPSTSTPPTATSVQLIPSTVSGTVTSNGVNPATLVLQSINGIPAADFNFAGTGTTSAQDATASAYTVELPSALTVSAPAMNTPAQFTGFVAPFGAAPPDFNALSLTSYADTSARLQVIWPSGHAMPFTTVSSGELLLSQAALQASTRHVIRVGFESIDPSTLAGGLQLVPDASAMQQYFAIGHVMSWHVEFFGTFSGFTAALNTDLAGSNTQVLQVGARGPYAAATGILSADEIDVLLND